MTPRIERQLMAQREYLPGAGSGSAFTVSHSHPSVGYAEPSVIYSSQRPPGNFPPPSLPSYSQLPSMSSDDAFIVRPRTSSTFHPILPVSSQPGLTEDHLRLMKSVTGPRQPPLPLAAPHQLSPRRTGPPSSGPFMMQCPPPAGRTPQPNLRLIPPGQFPPAPFTEAPPLSAPALSPTFNLIPRANPTNNAQLLSILNTPSLPRTTSSTSQPVLNNLGP